MSMIVVTYDGSTQLVQTMFLFEWRYWMVAVSRNIVSNSNENDCGSKDNQGVADVSVMDHLRG